MGINHQFVSSIPDDADDTLVRPSDWNADHAGHDLALHQELGIDALTAGEGIDITGGVITNTAHAPVDVTYAELKDLVDTAALKPNGKYRLTNFRTYQIIPFTDPAAYVTGPTEVLILEANTVSELSSIAISESYPKDIIYYELVCTHSFEPQHTPLCGGDRGWIYYREDTIQKNKLNYDFRACKWRRWYDPDTETYTIYNDNSEAYQDVYTFEDYTRVHNNDFAWGDSPDAPLNRPSYNNVFYNTAATEVYSNTGSVEFQNNTFVGRCYENRFGVRTSYNRFMVGVRYNNLKDNFNFAFIGGNFDANEVNMDCSSWTITGSCTGNRIGRSATQLTVTGNFFYNFLTHNCANLNFSDDTIGIRIASALSDYSFNRPLTNVTIGGDVPWDVSYDELFTEYDNSTLIPGQKYRIVDFETIYTIPNTAEQSIVAEPLIVTALGTNYLSHEAFSDVYPNDIIYYELVCQHTWDGNPIDATKGWIYYRKDTANNNEAPFDLRGCVWRRWETSVGSGVYTELTDPGNGEAYLDFSTFSNGRNNVIADGGYNIIIGTDCNFNRILIPNSKNITLPTATSNYILDLINGGTADAEQALLQIRRGTSTDWTNANPTLAEGEFAYETDVPRSFKIGDGSTAWNSLDRRITMTETEWAAIIDGGDADPYHYHPDYQSSFYLPTAITVTYGTLDAGDFSYLYGPSDGLTVDISEANGANALQVTVDFTDTVPRDPNALLVRARYSGGSAHSVAVEIYNYNTPGWEILGYISDSASQQIYSFPLFNGANYRTGSTSSVRFRHIETGNTAHDLFLDWVSVAKAAIGGGGVTEHSALGGLAHADHPESALILSDNTTGNVSTSAHGFCPKAPNDTAQFLRGDATWATPTATASMDLGKIMALARINYNL